MTNINFFLTISICCQEKWLWELIKWSLKGKCFDLLSNSQRNVSRSVWSSQLESLAPLAATHFFPFLCLIQCIVSSVFTSFFFILLLLYCNWISVNKWTWRIYMWIFELKGFTVILSIGSSYCLSSKLIQLHCTLIN